MKWFFFVGEFLFISLLALAVYFSGSEFTVFFDPPSFIVLSAGVLGMTLMSFTPGEISKAFSHMFGESGSREEMELSAYFWLCASRNLFLTGILATLIGLVCMLMNLSNPDSIGPAMGMALLTFFYAIVFSAMLPIPAYYSILKRIADMTEESAQSSHTVGVMYEEEV